MSRRPSPKPVDKFVGEYPESALQGADFPGLQHID
jgi:hypothetical protein